ncbi:MAG: hypothetical protein WBO29_05750 [Albidovulum sp.]
MAVYDNIHSRLVFWLKILLPLLALAILATLFLFSRHLEIDGELPFADVDVDELARVQRLTSPEYASVTSDGAAVQITAGTALPGDGDKGAIAKDLVAAIVTPLGLRIDLTAAEGRIDYSKNRLTLTRNVEIVTSTGYQILATGLDIALDRTELLSDGAIHATAPFGEIDSGKMELRLSNADIPTYLLVFDKGVKMNYRPVN